MSEVFLGYTYARVASFLQLEQYLNFNIILYWNTLAIDIEIAYKLIITMLNVEL